MTKIKKITKLDDLEQIETGDLVSIEGREEKIIHVNPKGMIITKGENEELKYTMEYTFNEKGIVTGYVIGTEKIKE